MEVVSSIRPLVTNMGAHNWSIFWLFVYMFGEVLSSTVAFFEAIFMGMKHQDWVQKYQVQKQYWDGQIITEFLYWWW